MKHLLKFALPVVFTVFMTGLNSCNEDKFLGFNYEAEQFIEIASISGEVRNIFTGDIVRNARIKIGSQVTFSNNEGKYQMEYTLTEDDRLNRAAPIEASAQDYHPFFSSRVIFPQPTEINISMVYGSPIIETTTFFGLNICQAIVMDYQGVNDIDSVFGEFAYLNPDSNNRVQQFVNTTLQRVGSISDNRARFEALIPVQIALLPDTTDTTGTGDRPPDTLFVSPTYNLIAVDKSGFTDRISHTNNSFNPDTLLFDPTVGQP